MSSYTPTLKPTQTIRKPSRTSGRSSKLQERKKEMKKRSIIEDALSMPPVVPHHSYKTSDPLEQTEGVYVFIDPKDMPVVYMINYSIVWKAMDQGKISLEDTRESRANLRCWVREQKGKYTLDRFSVNFKACPISVIGSYMLEAKPKPEPVEIIQITSEGE